MRRLFSLIAWPVIFLCLRCELAFAQEVEKVLITHSSESISITPLIYGIEKGFFRRQGIDLQFRVLRGFLRSLKAVQEDKKEVVEFIARKFALDAATAAETHRVVLRTLSDDGTVGDSALKDLLEQTKQETGVKKDINARDIVDDSLVRQRHKERRQGIRSELSQRGLFIL